MRKYSSRYNKNSENCELDEIKAELLSELSENSEQNLSVTLPSDLSQGIESVSQNLNQRWSAPPSPNLKQCKILKLKENKATSMSLEQCKKKSPLLRKVLKQA